MTNHIPAELLTSSGVYIIRNSINAKVYVGSAVNFRRRFNDHRNGLRKAAHHSQRLQNFANKYGIATLRFELLATCPAENLLAVEQTFIVMYRAANPAHGFNICPVAGSALGIKHSAESRNLMSVAKKAMSAETRRRMSAAQKLRAKPTAETRAKQSAARTGSTRSAETKRKISEAQKGLKKPAVYVDAMRTRKHSAETKAKIGAKSKGRIRTAQAIAKAKTTIAAKKLAL